MGRSANLLPRLPALALLGLLTACSPQGPSEVTEVAVKGMLSAAIDSSGRSALVGSLHHGGSLWSTSPAERRFDWNLDKETPSTFRAVALSSTTALTAQQQDLGVWNSDTGQSTGFYSLPAVVEALTLSSDGSIALAGMRDSRALLIDIASGATVHELAHKAKVSAVAISENGAVGLTGSDDNSAQSWSLRTGEPLAVFEHANQVTAVALNQDGSLAFSAAQREPPMLWNTSSGSKVAKLPLSYLLITSARFSADSTQLLVGTFQGEVYLVDATNGGVVEQWKAEQPSLFERNASRAVLSLAFSEDGGVMAALSNGTLQRFSLTSD